MDKCLSQEPAWEEITATWWISRGTESRGSGLRENMAVGYVYIFLPSGHKQTPPPFILPSAFVLLPGDVPDLLQWEQDGKEEAREEIFMLSYLKVSKKVVGISSHRQAWAPWGPPDLVPRRANVAQDRWIMVRLGLSTTYFISTSKVLAAHLLESGFRVSEGRRLCFKDIVRASVIALSKCLLNQWTPLKGGI